MNKDCIFCNIVNGNIPCKKVYEDNNCLAFHNIKPVASTHILIIPKKHIQNFLEIDHNFDFSKIIEFTKKIIIDKKIESGYKLVFNGGKYQQVPHLHWHLLSGNFKEKMMTKIK